MRQQRSSGCRALPFRLAQALVLTVVATAVAVGGSGLEWVTSQWGQCDKACGGGFQLRQVHCLDSLGQQAEVSGLCGGQQSDKVLAQRCNTEACGFFSFRIGEWSGCSQPCGSGVRTRQKTCMAEGGQEASSESLCSGLTANTGLSEPCNTAPCPDSTARWVVGEWQACNSTCGPGVSARSVRCLSSHGEPSEDCKGPGPAGEVSCESLPCGVDPCAVCGENTAECITESATCLCQEGWTGARCTVPQACESGVVDAAGDCCASGVLNIDSQCCQGEGGSLPVTDVDGQCCVSSQLLDACGVCGGPSLSLDILGVCCPGPLDAAGYCCSSGYLDACQVCDGDRQPGATCEATCGNGICEAPEGPWGPLADSCGQDCPLAIQGCPRGEAPSLGGSQVFCSSRGSCLIGTAACDCFSGYAGEACGACAGGWEKTPGGLCVPAAEVVILEETPPPEAIPAATPAPSGPVISVTVAVVLVAVGAVLVLALLALLFAICCLRSRAIDGLQLYPVLDTHYRPRPGAQMSQVTVFTPGAVTRKAYPSEPGWEPIDPALNSWLGSAPALGDTLETNGQQGNRHSRRALPSTATQPMGYRVSTPTGILGSRASIPLAASRAPGSNRGVKGLLVSLPPAVRQQSLPKLSQQGSPSAYPSAPRRLGFATGDLQLANFPSLERSGVVGSFEVSHWPPRLLPEEHPEVQTAPTGALAVPFSPSKPGAGVFIERPCSKQGTTRPGSVTSVGDVALVGTSPTNSRPSSSQAGRPGWTRSRPGTSRLSTPAVEPGQAAVSPPPQPQAASSVSRMRGKSVRFPKEFVPEDDEQSHRGGGPATRPGRASQRSLLGGLSSLFSSKMAEQEATGPLQPSFNSSASVNEKTMGEIISDMPLPVVVGDTQGEQAEPARAVRLPSVLSESRQTETSMFPSGSTGLSLSRPESRFKSQEYQLLEDTGRLAALDANFWAGDDDE